MLRVRDAIPIYRNVCQDIWGYREAGITSKIRATEHRDCLSYKSSSCLEIIWSLTNSPDISQNKFWCFIVLISFKMSKSPPTTKAKIFYHPREWPLWTDMTGRAWRVACFASLGAMVFGYDTAWWGGVLGMPAFTSRYGVYNPTTKTYAISAPLASAGRFSLSLGAE